MLRELLQKESLEKRIESNQTKLDQLEARAEELEAAAQEFYAELDVKPEQIDKLLQMPEEFTPEAWEEIQKEAEGQMEELLQYTRRDIARTRRTYEQNGEVQRHWLFVK